MNAGAIKGVPVNTLYKTIKNSTPAEFAKDKPVIAAVGATGTAVIAAEVMSKSTIAMQIGKKGLIPAVAAGVVITGAAMIHDTVANNTPVADDKSTLKNEHLRHNVKNTAKVGVGTAMILGGTEVIGHAYDINALKPVTALFTGKVAEKVVLPAVGIGVAAAGVALINNAINGDKPADITSDKPEENAQALFNGVKVVAGSILIGGGTEMVVRAIGINVLENSPFSTGIGLSATGTAIALAGAKNMKEKGVGVGNSTALTAGSLIVTGFASDFVPAFLTNKESAISGKATSFVGGAGLGLMSYALAKSAKNSISEGHKNIAALSAVGSATAAVASIHFLGNATGVEALSNLAPKVFGKNPLLAGAIVATGLSVGSYIIYSNSKEAEGKSEVKTSK